MIEAAAPHWTTYVQALGAPFVALVAGAIASWIAYQQWQTARAKVVLDLFEKRLEVYKLVTEPIFAIMMHGSSNVDHEVTGPFARGLIQSRFLFGPEIYAYLEFIWRTINKLGFNSRAQARAMQEDRLEGVLREEDELFTHIAKFHDTFDEMMFPYLRMDQKLRRPKRFPLVHQVRQQLGGRKKSKPRT